MPTSRSIKPSVDNPIPVRRARFLLPLILSIVMAVLVVVVVALPASLLGDVLPPLLHAEDFSGSIWHGSAGKILVNSRPAGALEWHIHPWPLCTLTLSADVHWVNIGFVADGRVDIDRHGALARRVQGGGPIEDLYDLGMAGGWRGESHFEFSTLRVAFVRKANDLGTTILAAVGTVRVTGLAAQQIAGGADLGGYALTLADGAITPDTNATAQLSDTGGPLEVHAVIHYAAQDRLATLTGTVKERADAAPALRDQLNNIAQLQTRDAAGRIPVDLEFTL